MPLDLKENSGAFRTADPLPLHLLDGFRPIHQRQVVDQPLGIGRDTQHPLPHRYPYDRMPAALALAVDHFLVGQHGSQRRAPIHRDFRQIRQSLFIEFLKDPLSPSHVPGIRGIDFPRPVVIHAQGLKLPFEVFNVPFGGLPRMGPGFNRILFRRQAEGVPSHGMQHVPAPHPFVASDDVGRDIALGMADVESGSRRVWEHVEDVKLGLGRVDAGTKRLMLAPVGLPFRFNGLVIVEFGHGPDERGRAMIALRLG